MNTNTFFKKAYYKFREEGVRSSLRFLYNNLVIWRIIQWYNTIRQTGTYNPPTDDPEYYDVIKQSRNPSDISDHLRTLYTESLKQSPTTIVELGVRGGVSTSVFERMAERCGAQLISVDIEDCSNVSDYEDWHFVQSDGRKFGKRFESWATANGIDPEIDVLFIDTTHKYDETKAEINAWFPHLSETGIVFFHDTNLRKIYRRKDGSIGMGWDNERAVVRVLEDYFNASFDETEPFKTVYGDFVIDHDPYCNGLTTLNAIQD